MQDVPGQSASQSFSKTISVTVNGARESSHASTLSELVEEFGFTGERVATALNGTFVPQSNRAATVIEDGDTIEVLSARQGG